eukprot:Phypoly_transcript_23835.p1 GENE.Phypoly_transcript_23835~~Phypoly_transcript_23835.p1  ORF type:complete len:177 (-),score=20.53 Phypoly_transcript_23835:37-546(-)
MGISGCGKSTIAEALSHKEPGWIYYDADTFHSPENVKKMSNGIPLTDEDRKGWLAGMKKAIDDWLSIPNQVCFLACSALKKAYRDILADTDPKIYFIFLQGSKELIKGRIEHRHGHYMPASLLDSQFNTLEDPTKNPDENSRTIPVSIEPPVDEVIEDAYRKVKAKLGN